VEFEGVEEVFDAQVRAGFACEAEVAEIGLWDAIMPSSSVGRIAMAKQVAAYTVALQFDNLMVCCVEDPMQPSQVRRAADGALLYRSL
jgi:hypothetical protein